MDRTVIQINTGNITNVFLIRGRTGCILVDTGVPGKVDLVIGRLAKCGFAPGDVRLILITHGHTDHFGGAAALRELTGAPVAIHTLDAEAVRRGIHAPGSLQPTGSLAAFLVQFPALRELAAPDRAPAFEPDLLLDGERRLDEYGVAGRVIHTSGHTPGSVSVILDNGEAIVGDMVVNRWMGLLRKPGLPLTTWDPERNRESIRQLLALSPRVVYTGHGGPFEAADLSSLVGTER
jgi:hydroxyacylglutathione hydrolase